MEDLPAGFSVPEGRVKPWGTLHALLSARDMVDAPFAAINADDFYGRDSFKAIHDFLVTEAAPHCHAMVGFNVENTLTENGSVSRGVCEKDANGYLTEVVERTTIYPRPGGAAYVEDGKETFIPAGTPVSMNLWGYSPDILEDAMRGFAPFLAENLPKNPLKCEYFLPLVADQLIHAGKATFKVLPTDEKWYGVTYANDLQSVKDAIRRLKDEGKYPEKLWARIPHPPVAE